MARAPRKPSVAPKAKFRAAEFFAGIGLVRMALAEADIEVTFANDIEPIKAMMYGSNFDASHYKVGDVRNVHPSDIGRVDLATASFPCTDLSLAGNRLGLAGEQSSMVWEFARVLDEFRDATMFTELTEADMPRVVALENVYGFATSNGGVDLYRALKRLNELGYTCDIVAIDARHFLPQSRPRMFIVGSRKPVLRTTSWASSNLRPEFVTEFVDQHPDLDLQAADLPDLPESTITLNAIVESFKPDHPLWWPDHRRNAFRESLSTIQERRLLGLTDSGEVEHRTAYRRTRRGKATWEIRPDSIAGCLRAVNGGSSKQAVVQAGSGSWRVRWMTEREYARLMGAPDFSFDGLTVNQALFGFGDAVCVPAFAWLAKSYLRPLLDGDL